ncbi:hypothetical protein JAAARDRAFT_346368 [Jaapia argillacea MUCL 33604]|uniref:Uncharacterized protein n=1 Tax=Jaapia argillacea MUCL 33604 TaxID=933084 RepID=A0A067PN90_9AGAM|nr:hypothetical protein JAAARDRAFT_346368 [Jaapia argillacea MUCL 33604]
MLDRRLQGSRTPQPTTTTVWAIGLKKSFLIDASMNVNFSAPGTVSCPSQSSQAQLRRYDLHITGGGALVHWDGFGSLLVACSCKGSRAARLRNYHDLDYWIHDGSNSLQSMELNGPDVEPGLVALQSVVLLSQARLTTNIQLSLQCTRVYEVPSS